MRESQTRADQTAGRGRRRVYTGWVLLQLRVIFCKVKMTEMEAVLHGTVAMANEWGPGGPQWQRPPAVLLPQLSQLALPGAELCPWAPRALLASLLWWTLWPAPMKTSSRTARQAGFGESFPVTRGDGVAGELPVSVSGREGTTRTDDTVTLPGPRQVKTPRKAHAECSPFPPAT